MKGFSMVKDNLQSMAVKKKKKKKVAPCVLSAKSSVAH